MKSLRAARLGNFLIAVITFASIIYPCIVIRRWEKPFPYPSTYVFPYSIIISGAAICIGSIFNRIGKKLRKCPKCKSEIPINLLKERTKELFCPYCKEPLFDGYNEKGTTRLRIKGLRAAILLDFLSTILFVTLFVNLNVVAVVIQGGLLAWMCTVVSAISAYCIGIIPYKCPKCNYRLSLSLFSQKKKDVYCPQCKEKLWGKL